MTETTNRVVELLERGRRLIRAGKLVEAYAVRLHLLRMCGSEEGVQRAALGLSR